LFPKNFNGPPRPGVEPLDDENKAGLMWASRPKVNRQKDDLLAMQMLYAYGLVEEHVTSSIVQPQLPANLPSSLQITFFLESCGVATSIADGEKKLRELSGFPRILLVQALPFASLTWICCAR